MRTTSFNPILEAALGEAKHPQVAAALRTNVELGLMTVAQAENGDFIWSITEKGREHVRRQAN